MLGKKSIVAFVKRDGTSFNYRNVLDVAATGMSASDTYCSSFYLVPTDVTRETLNMVATQISFDADEALEYYMAADQFVFAN